jgi:hypothetical protein
MRLVAWLSSILLFAAPAAPVGATPFLVGAQLYASGSDGTNVGATSGVDYQYSTNSSTTHQPFPINGGSGSAIVFALSPGDNVFTFDVLASFGPGDFAGLNLFFAGTATSYDPPHTGVGIPGDLAVFSATDGLPGLSVPDAGTNLQSYESSGTSVSSTSYSGATTFVVGSDVIRVTAFSVDDKPMGSFTINVVPEPGTASLLLMGVALLGAFGRRSRGGLGVFRPSGDSAPRPLRGGHETNVHRALRPRTKPNRSP